MRNHVKRTMQILAIILIAVWILSRIPFAADIKQTIAAEKYVNGVAVEETTVFISGARSNYLFANSQYFDGQFIIEAYERTGREAMKANIEWPKNSDIQRILYYQNATFPSLGIHFELLINKEMDDFAIGFKDGTVISTSKEMYETYMEKLSQRLSRGE